MKAVALILAVTLCLATTLPVDDGVVTNTDVNARNSVLEELFLGILETIREQMLTGSEDFPVMDPLEIEDLHLEFDELGFENSHLSASNVEARYLSTFVVDDLSLVMTSVLLQRYTMDVEGHISVLEIDCEKYDLNVNALGTNVFGAGSAKLRIVEPRITARIEFSLSILTGMSLTIRSADITFFLGGFEPQITGLFGTTMTDEFVNAFLTHLVPQLVEFYQAEISEIINSIIMDIGTIDLSRGNVAVKVQVAGNPELPPINA